MGNSRTLRWHGQEPGREERTDPQFSAAKLVFVPPNDQWQDLRTCAVVSPAL